MPMYAYRCRECENDFEARQKFSDDPLTTCRICHTDGSIFRVIQPAGVVFKGSGFYVTDTRSKNGAAKPPAKSESSNGASESKSDANGSTSSETPTTPSKPAAESSTSSSTSASAPAGD